MNIVYTLNDKFVPQVAAGMCSVCENNTTASKIHFFIISSGIASQNKAKMRSMVKKYKRDITIIELKEISTYFDFSFDTFGWNSIVLARLLIDKILPEEVERVIYLDGDTIVRGNIEELWNTKMGKCVIGASLEPTVGKKRKVSLGLENSYYYNAGVLLIDLKKWKKEKTGEKIIKYYKENDGRLFANDQDAINGALRNKIFTLSPTYNFYNIYTYYPYKLLSKLSSPAKYIDKKIFDYAVGDPKIIHYLGEERPWRKGNTHLYRDDYKKYLSMTAWGDVPDEEGWETYFLCWRIFNFGTKLFPMLRYKIINGLIPTFMKYRAKKRKHS